MDLVGDCPVVVLEVSCHRSTPGPDPLSFFLGRLASSAWQADPHGPRVVGDAPFTTFSTTVVALAEGGVPGLGLAHLEALPTSVVRGLRDAVCATDRRDVSAACLIPRVRSHPIRVIVRITAHGRFRGTPLSLPTFSFPLARCCGCLVAFSAAADLDAPEHPGPDCLAALPPGVAPAHTPGQDEPQSCGDRAPPRRTSRCSAQDASRTGGDRSAEGAKSLLRATPWKDARTAADRDAVERRGGRTR